MDPKQIELSGSVVRQGMNGGSKSENDAVALKGDDGSTYLLRKQGGPAFGDESLDSLVGSDLTVNGLAIGNTLIMKNWRTKK